MKSQITKLFLLVAILLGFQGAQSQITFTVTSSTGSYSVSCTNPTLALSASSNYTGGTVGYTWTGSSFPLPVYSNSLAVSAGIYTVIASSGTVFSQPQTFTITGTSFPPTANVFMDTTALTCKNPSLVLYGYTNVPNATFQWSGPLPVAPGSTYTVFNGGNYTLNVSVSAPDCPSATTVVTIGDNRVFPIIVYNLVYTVSCPNGTVALTTVIQNSPSVMSFSWSVPQGAMVTGANTGTLITNAPGAYQISVTNTVTGCTSKAILNVWNCVGIEEQNSIRHLSVFPNPVKENLYFKSEQSLSGSLDLEIRNILGESVHSEKNVEITKAVDLEFLNPGVYYLHLKNAEGQSTFKIVKD